MNNYAPPCIIPEPLIAVIIITVSKIRTTIAPITIKMSNQSVTLDIACPVSLITPIRKEINTALNLNEVEEIVLEKENSLC